MKVFLNIIRFAGILLFGLAAFLMLVAILNFFINFTELRWMEPPFIRFYLFLAVIGILAYILVTFRRKQ